MEIKDSGDRTMFNTGRFDWKNIEFLVGKEFKYIANSDGYFALKNGTIYSAKTGKTLTPIEDKYGYLFVNIYDKKGKMKSRKIHRLIAETFIPNPFEYPQVNHIDDDKKNNLRNVCNGIGKTLCGKRYKWYKVESIPPLTEKEKKYARRYIKGENNE